MAPEPFSVRDFAEYVVRLRAAKVILDGAERRALIARGADELAQGKGLVLADDPGLLDELKGLVEWPVPLLAAIDEAFMAVPPEVLVTTMRANQKYLALRTAEGSLARRFILVANLEASDGGAAIVAGNERVLRARLWTRASSGTRTASSRSRAACPRWRGCCSTRSWALRRSASSGW